MLPAIPIDDPGKAALLFSRSIGDGMLEHHAHLDKRTELIEEAYYLSPILHFHLDPAARDQAVAQLNDVYLECKDAGWDGYNALPISYATYRKAIDFLDALPARLPRPEFVPENDGELALEWRDPRGKVLSVSLSSNGRMTVLYLPERMRTTLYWTKAELPRPLIKLIELFA